jgi:hypothetical protein
MPTERPAERLLLASSGHGSLFQFRESFTRHAAAFLAVDSPFTCTAVAASAHGRLKLRFRVA